MKMNSYDCRSCKFLKKNIDTKEWVHYTCEYAPNIEWLGGMCEEPLNSLCGKYKHKDTSVNKRGK